MSSINEFTIKDGVLEKYKGSAETVIIPEGVMSIGNEAFRYCSSLKSITIPEGVMSIGNYAFYRCSSLTSITIPEGVTSIGDSAFSRCSSLTSITIPEGVTNIGDSAFYNCSSLTSITIPEGVTSIGDSAFSRCSSLTNVSIPSTIESIGSLAFEGCNKLADEAGFVIINGVLFDYFGKGVNIAISEGVTSIGNKAFRFRSSLKSITIPEGVTSIGDYAFDGCESLTSITIPEGVMSIGDSAFMGCLSLTSVTIPKGVTHIGDNIFNRCVSLTSITIPEGVTSIGKYAFNGCESLTSITIPEGVTSIGYSAFNRCVSLTSITIPEGVISIGDSAFSGCRSLTSITIPEGVTSVGDYAFNGCRSLTRITIPSTVKTIGERAFDMCTDLMSFKVDNETVKIGKDIFGNTVPDGLKEDIKELWPMLTDGSLKKYILEGNVWNTLSSDTQAEIFLSRQGKPVLSAYSAYIGNNCIDGMGEAIIGKLEGGVSAKEYSAAAQFMTMFHMSASDDVLRSIYAALKKGGKKADKAIKIVTDDIQLMQKLNGKSVTGSMTMEERAVCKWLEARNLSVASLEKTIKDFYGLEYKDLPSVSSKDSKKVKPYVLAWILTIHETLNRYGASKIVTAGYEQPGICKEAKEVIDLLDADSLQAAIRKLADSYLNIYQNTQKKFLTYPICRYANESVMAELTKRAPKWRTSVSGNDAPPLLQLRDAIKYSDTRAAMMFAERYHELEAYANLRGIVAQDLRDEFMSDIGLDETGKKTYDLGNTIIDLTVDENLEVSLYDTKAGKPVKSIPKRGADAEKYEAAKADYTEVKKNVKKIVKARANLLFEAFLDGRTFKAEGWKKAYFGNPLLNHVARLVVWEQNGKTFTLKAKTLVNSTESEVELTDSPISVAHPMEMNAEDVVQWQKYFTVHGLKQPFAQIWEPVIDPAAFKPDRYKGIMIPFYRFRGMEKHGIYVEDNDFHNEIDISFKGCNAAVERIDWRRHEINNEDNFEVNQISFDKFTRQTNHVIAYLDKVTVYGRVIKDDVSVTEQLPQFTLAQITEFIKVAGENNCSNVMAVLLDYKEKNYGGYDPMDEFTLDL